MDTLRDYLNNLGEFFDKEVEIITTDGKIFKGCIIDFFNGDDFMQETDSIFVNCKGEEFEIPGDEIKSVKII